MSLLDSTIETDKEKEILIKGEKCASSLYYYGEQIFLPKESNIRFYNPSDINLLYENYKIDNRKVYGASLSATEIHIGYERQSGCKVAIKELKKAKLKDFMQEFAKNEMTIHDSMARVSGNVCKVKDYFEDDKAFYMVMEFSDEPNYFEDMLENRYCPISEEKILKAFAFDILTALKELHKNKIIHCDIKPQNFLLFKNENMNTSNNNSLYGDESLIEDYFLKLTDFGLAHVIPEGNEKAFMKYPCGTFQYTAPEVTKNCYVDKSIDIWSFGICLYQMAVAYFPTAIKQYKYGSGPIPFRACDWAGFDFKKLKDLIERCLQIDPAKRITVTEALNHCWFDEY